MTKYKICTYNIGHSFFFNDSKKRKNIINNLNNQIELLNNIDANIYLLQEVSNHLITNKMVNTHKLLRKNITNQNTLYAPNTNMPLIDSGLLTISKDNSSNTKITIPYKYKNVIKNKTILNKMIIKTEIDNLIIYNIHLTSYKENKELRIKQFKYIYELVNKELNKNIIIGGDFNITSEDMNTIKSIIDVDKWNIVFPDTKTHRNNNIYDGFIVSNNIKVLKMENINNLIYSDHSPITIEIEI